MRYTPFGRHVGIPAAMLLSATAVGQMPRLEVGKPFPDLVLPALDDGRPMSVADFRGQKIILFVFASW